MKLVTKAVGLVAVAAVVALVAQRAGAVGVEGRSYSYETIYTPDNPETDTGCGHFVEGPTDLTFHRLQVVGRKIHPADVQSNTEVGKIDQPGSIPIPHRSRITRAHSDPPPGISRLPGAA